MTKEERAKIEKNLKPNQVAVDIQHHEIGVDEFGFPEYEIIYEKSPKNYKLIRVFEGIKGAILEDLDYDKESNITN